MSTPNAPSGETRSPLAGKPLASPGAIPSQTKAERFTFINGLAVTAYGPETAQPILMSAGLGGHGAYWGPQIAAFADAHQVILYDHRGTGDSARDLPSPYAVSDMADDMLRILDGLDIQSAHIVGHAAGAVAGLELARKETDRVKSLTVVNGWARADPWFKRCFEIRTAIYRTGGAEAYLRAQPVFLFPAEWIADHLDELDAQAVQHAPGFQSEATLMARIAALSNFDITDDYERITCPVLVIGALDDMLVPVRCSVNLADRLPLAHFIGLPWGGHAVNVTVPEDFNAQLLAFFKAQNELEQGS